MNDINKATHYKKLNDITLVSVGVVSDGAFIELGGMLGSKAKEKGLILYKKPRKKPSREESNLQISCIVWFRLQYPKLSKALFSVPNGGTRNKAEAKVLKAEGATAGVSDLILAIPNKENSGVFIEMKAKKGTLSKDQKEFLALMKSLGYGVEVVRTFDKFVEIVNNQMRGR